MNSTVRPWAKWCLAHRVGWAVFAALIICFPVYLLIGCYQGAVGLAKEWAGDWRSIQRITKGETLTKE